MTSLKMLKSRLLSLAGLLIRLLLLCGVLSFATAVIFEDLPVMSHFSVEDTVRPALWHADLVLEFDLRDIFQAINATCNLATLYDASLMPRALVSHLREVCHFDLHSFRTYHDFLTGSTSRRPRFLLATLLMSVVTGIGGYIFGSSHSTSQTDVQLMANQEHFVQLFRENDHRAVLMQSEIHSPAQLVRNNSESLKSSLVLLAIFFFQSKQLAVTFRALETLLLDKRLSLGLLAPELVMDKFGHLAQQIEKSGKALAISTEIDLFNCLVSFGTFTYERVRVVVHVPVFDPAMGDFKLYRYHNVPISVSRDFMRVKVDPDQYLLVNADRSLHFYALSLELSRCAAHLQVLSCSRFAGLRASASPSCLWGIFTSDDVMVH